MYQIPIDYRVACFQQAELVSSAVLRLSSVLWRLSVLLCVVLLCVVSLSALSLCCVLLCVLLFFFISFTRTVLLCCVVASFRKMRRRSVAVSSPYIWYIYYYNYK